MTTKRRKRHSPEQIVRKLRDADAMLTAGKDLAAVLQSLEVSEATLHRWRAQYGGMKAEEAVRLKKLEDENKRLKEVVADLTLDNRMLKYVVVPEKWSAGRVGMIFRCELGRIKRASAGAMFGGERLWRPAWLRAAARARKLAQKQPTAAVCGGCTRRHSAGR